MKKYFFPLLLFIFSTKITFSSSNELSNQIANLYLKNNLSALKALLEPLSPQERENALNNPCYPIFPRHQRKFDRETFNYLIQNGALKGKHYNIISISSPNHPFPLDQVPGLEPESCTPHFDYFEITITDRRAPFYRSIQ